METPSAIGSRSRKPRNHRAFAAAPLEKTPLLHRFSPMGRASFALPVPLACVRQEHYLSIMKTFFSALALAFVAVACGSSGESIGSPLASGAYATCRQACIDHATPSCTSACESSCYGLCEGNMPAANFPYVDRIDCTGGAVTFHEGSSQVTCTP